MPNQLFVEEMIGRNIKVLFYTDSTYYSGAEKSFAILYKSHLKNGGQGDLMVCPVIASSFRRDVGSEGKIISRVTRSKLSLKWYFELKKYLKREKPDYMVINMWSPYANTLALVAANSLKVPVVGIYHYFQEKKQVNGILAPIKLWAYRYGERKMKIVATVSQKHQQVLIEQFHFPADKTAVIPNSVPSDIHELEFKDHQPRRLLAVGSLEPAKGYAFLLEALKKITVPWELDILGDGPDREELQNIAEDCMKVNKFGRVKFLGRQSNVINHYLNADVLVHPSEFENLSMAIIESMAYGLTAIANDVGGNAELIQNDKTGWLLPMGDQDAWRQTLMMACSHDLSAKKKAAHDLWCKSFTPEYQYESFIRLLSNLDKVYKQKM